MLQLNVSDILVLLLFCHTEGCPGLCNGNGRCTLGNSGWYCVCQLGWRGTGCDTSMETACTDVKDNDGGKNITLTLTLNKLRQEHLISHNCSIENIGFSEYAGLLCFVLAGSQVHFCNWKMINDSETVARTTGFFFYFILSDSNVAGMSSWACIVPRSMSLSSN